jgi:hypothetical protein
MTNIKILILYKDEGDRFLKTAGTYLPYHKVTTFHNTLTLFQMIICIHIKYRLFCFFDLLHLCYSITSFAL